VAVAPYRRNLTSLEALGEVRRFERSSSSKRKTSDSSALSSMDARELCGKAAMIGHYRLQPDLWGQDTWGQSRHEMCAEMFGQMFAEIISCTGLDILLVPQSSSLSHLGTRTAIIHVPARVRGSGDLPGISWRSPDEDGAGGSIVQPFGEHALRFQGCGCLRCRG
jgi:hypothetical protein